MLAVLGADSDSWFREGHKLLLQLLPQAEELVLPDATHGMQVMNPEVLAHALDGFFARYPLPASATGV